MGVASGNVIVGGVASGNVIIEGMVSGKVDAGWVWHPVI